MIFLANRANLSRRTVLRSIHSKLRTQVTTPAFPVTQVWYHPSKAVKTEVRATVDAAALLRASYPCDTVELHVTFDFPRTLAHDSYRIQWVDPERQLMIGWHQDDTHPELGECHLQVDYEDETVQRVAATYLDTHPLNVFDQRCTHLQSVIPALTWRDRRPQIPSHAVQ